MRDKDATEVLQADRGGLLRAAGILRNGGLVAVPTETVYGLAARADDPAAVARIYAAKGRPSLNPLIVHVRDAGHADEFVTMNDAARRLADGEWPGPLTLVLPRRDGAGIAPAVAAGLPTLAVRAPAHPAMRALLQAVDFPLAAPSANPSGRTSPTCASHVLDGLAGRIDAVIDGGASSAGLESTILTCRAEGEWELLRPGPLDPAELAARYALSLSAPGSGVRSDRIEAPGQLSRHYAPGKPVRLNAAHAQGAEFLIGFGDVAGDVNLSTAGDALEAAANLYDCLHRAAASSAPSIAVAPIPNTGIGKAINDRLARAAR